MISWANLNERERQIVAIGSGCVLLYLCYLLIYAPLTNAVVTKSRLLGEKRETLVWMQHVRQQPTSKKNAQPINSSKLLTLIASQLNTPSFQKYPYQLQQTGQGDVQLSFDTVPYHKFLIWLWQLNNDYVIRLKQLTMERTPTAGVVKVSIIIKD